MSIDNNEIIYLDNEFIVKKYSEKLGKDAPVRYMKTTDVSIGINMLAKAGASLKETYEYPISTLNMYKQLENSLDEIDILDLNESDIRNLPNLFWMEGLFGIISMKSNKEEIERYNFCAASEKGKKQLFLATNDIYFSSGYDQLLNFASSFADNFTIKAKILLKFLGNTRNFSIATPLVVLKKENFHNKKNP